MGEEERNAMPANITPSPFDAPPPPPPRARAPQTYVGEGGEGEEGGAAYRWQLPQQRGGGGGDKRNRSNQGGGDGDSKRMRGGGDADASRSQGGGGVGGLLPTPPLSAQQTPNQNQRAPRPPPPPPAPCWFCLASPEVEKHLIATIGTHAYLALPKGGIVDDHVLLVPIEHIPSFLFPPPDIDAEAKQFQAALKKMWGGEGKQLVVFERNTFTKGAKHAHLQMVPVDSSLSIAQIKQTVKEEGSKCDLDFEEKPAGDEWKKNLGGEMEYFMLELPNGEVLLHVVKPRARFPLQFGRQAICALLQCPERIDWKACAKSKAEEEELTAAFRKKFAPFDFSE